MRERKNRSIGTVLTDLMERGKGSRAKSQRGNIPDMKPERKREGREGV